MKTLNDIKPCAGYEERLILSRYGELGPEEEKALGAHLSGCPACRAYMEGLGRTLVSLPDTEAGPFAANKAARAVMERIAVPHARPAYMRYLAPAFATLAVVAVAAWFSLNQSPVVTNAPAPVTVASSAPAETPAAAPANVIANTTGHDNTHLAQSDVEIAQNIEMLADLDLMEDIDTVDRIERL